MNCQTGDSSNDALSKRSRNETLIDNYKILKTLEKGKFGVVQLAKHKLTGEKVAIKVVHKLQLNSCSLKDIWKEAEIIKTLDHPNIIKVLQIIDTENTFHLVMEYASNGDLFRRLDLGRMEEKEAKEKFRQVVSAIRYCHEEKNVIHRDLKPENILFDNQNNVKIADFGLSEEFIPGVKLDTFCGTPEYMAPELFQGHKFDGPKVDVWSLGVMLYEMITGTVPFSGSTWQNIGERVVRGKYYVPDYISTDCRNLLNKTLVLDPNQRATIHMIMKDTWVNLDLEPKQFSRSPSHVGG
jgi:MAP/microtubule affinity-regulating kinase